MNKLIFNCWIVGDAKWKGGIAHVVLANNKTAARQLAEHWLAYALWEWENRGEKELQRYLDRPRSIYKNIDEMVKAYAGGEKIGSYSYQIKQYVMVKNGVWIRCIENGEALHITKPSIKAVKERARLEKKSAVWSDKMIKGLLVSIKT